AADRLGERAPSRIAARRAADTIERIHELAVATDERVERHERRWRRTVRSRMRVSGERLRALEPVRQLRPAPGPRPAAGHQVHAFPRHRDEQIGVRHREPAIAPPEAPGNECQQQRRLDRAPPAAYDPATRSRMAPVSRLPAIYFEKLLERSPDIVVGV